MQKGSAKAEALGLAFGEFVGKAIGEGAEVGEFHDFLNAFAAFVVFKTECAGVEIEVFQYGHVVIIPKMVGHPTDEGAYFVGMMDDVDATDFGGAHGGVVEGGQNPHGGGFSCSIGSHESAY